MINEGDGKTFYGELVKYLLWTFIIFLILNIFVVIPSFIKNTPFDDYKGILAVVPIAMIISGVLIFLISTRCLLLCKLNKEEDEIRQYANRLRSSFYILVSSAVVAAAVWILIGMPKYF